MANPARAYLATQVETTSQGELLIMLYEAAIKFLKRAQMEIDNKDYAKKGIYISKAMAIIHELAECLNKEKGGEITPKLSQLYMFCTSQLIKANIRLDKKMIEEVIKIMDGLRSAYAQIVPMHEGNGAQPNPSAPPIQPVTRPQETTTEPPAAPEPSTGYSRPQTQATPQAQPAAPSVPQAPHTPPAPTPQQAQAAREQLAGVHHMAPPVQPVQSQPAEQPPAQPQASAPPEPETSEGKAEQNAPQPPAGLPQQPPKLRTAFNAAKFRAANAYTTNNS
jgi:flagellar protein FliS